MQIFNSDKATKRHGKNSISGLEDQWVRGQELGRVRTNEKPRNNEQITNGWKQEGSGKVLEWYGKSLGLPDNAKVVDRR